MGDERVEAWTPMEGQDPGGRPAAQPEITPVEQFDASEATGGPSEATEQPVARSLLREFRETSLDAQEASPEAATEAATNENVESCPPIKKASSLGTMLRRSIVVAEGATSKVKAGEELDARMARVNEKAKEEKEELYHSTEKQRALRVLTRMSRAANDKQEHEKRQAERRSSIWSKAKKASDMASVFAMAGKERETRRGWLASGFNRRRGGGATTTQKNEYTEANTQMQIDELKRRMAAHVAADELVEAAKLSRELAELEGGGAAAGPRPSVVPTKGKAPRMSYLVKAALSPGSRVAPTADP